MKIVKYEKDKKDYYNIYLSNGEIITLKEKVITVNELLLKKEIDKELYNKLLYDNKICEYLEMGIKYASVRLRSVKEMNDYLYKKSNDMDLSREVTDKLIEKGYLDDNRFAKAFIKDKLSFTNMGDYKLKMELMRLGVDNDIIEDNLSNIEDSVFDNRMRKIIDKDLKTNKKYTGLKLKNKIYNHLLSQGYGKERVISIINEYDF